MACLHNYIFILPLELSPGGSAPGLWREDPGVEILCQGEFPQGHHLEKLLLCQLWILPGLTSHPQASLMHLLSLTTTQSAACLHAALLISHAGSRNLGSVCQRLELVQSVGMHSELRLPPVTAGLLLDRSNSVPWKVNCPGGLGRFGQDVWLGKMLSMIASFKVSVTEN